jgi:hypothetical protein
MLNVLDVKESVLADASATLCNIVLVRSCESGQAKSSFLSSRTLMPFVINLIPNAKVTP